LVPRRGQWQKRGADRAKPWRNHGEIMEIAFESGLASPSLGAIRTERTSGIGQRVTFDHES
jgi:hypothetical protein